MKPLRIFRASGDCGCGSSSYSQTLSNTGACADPASGAQALICDPKYYNLGTILKMRLLGVPLGGSCQMFLKGPVLSPPNPRGFVFMDSDGQVYVENEPKLTLPFLNPAVEGVYPRPGGFAYLQVGVGPDPITWKHLVAPSAGEWSLQSVNGVWQLRDITSGSGNTAVCANNATTPKGMLVCCIDTGDLDEDDNPIYALRKLAVSHQRLIVGDVDDDGVTGYKQLAADEYLRHELAVFPDLKVGSYQQTVDASPDNETTLEADGMKVQIPVDADPVVLCGYNPTTHKFERLAERTKEAMTMDGDVVVADSGAYVTMGGHAKFTNVQFNFPDFYFSCGLRVANDDATPRYDGINYGLFIDGVQVHTWDVKGSKDAALALIYKGIPIGVHTVEVRFLQTAGAGVTSIKYSNANIFTVL